MKIELCKRCLSKVTRKPKLITDGYYAYCSTCNEDMDKSEIFIKIKRGKK